jgi:SAM-dependent methyltransferase
LPVGLRPNVGGVLWRVAEHVGGQKKEEAMELEEMKRHWDSFGKTDPLWAILTEPSKKNQKWDLEEFFETGRNEILEVLKRVNALPFGLRLDPRFEQVKQGDQWMDWEEIRKGRALDFGCGVGRLTQAMCLFFEECHGVEIAPSMIELARQYNRYRDRCFYRLNDRADLRLFGSDRFDFVYSNIVLQHMEPALSQKYIGEFVRVMIPGGVLVFQIPSEPADLWGAGTIIDHSLPDSGFVAEITVLKDSCVVAPGSGVEIPVCIRNAGRCLWPARGLANTKYQIHLGNHWLDCSGKMLVLDDMRMPLPNDIASGEEARLVFSVKAPQRSGDYLLELDLVQEQVTWFAEKNSKTARIPVRVQETEETGVEKAIFSPKMEMYGVRKDQVVSLVEEAGGRILVAEEDFYAPGWHGFRYYVTK